MPGIVQEAHGTALSPATPFQHTVSLDTPAAAGNTVVLIYYSATLMQTGPPEMILDLQNGTSSNMTFWWRQAGVYGGEQNWVVTHFAANVVSVWRILELEALDASKPVDATGVTAPFNSSSATTVATGNAAASDDTLALGVHTFFTSNWPNGGTFANFSGHTGGFTEDLEFEYFTPGGTDHYAVSFSSLPVPTAATIGSTATFNTDKTRNAADGFSGSVVAYKAAVPVLEIPADVMASGG